MSIYKATGSPFYHYDFQINGHRFHGSTKTGNRREAEAIERQLKEKAKDDVKEKKKTGTAPMTFDAAAGRYWLEKGKKRKRAHKHFNTIQKLVDFFGKRRLDQIDDAAMTELVEYRLALPRWGTPTLKAGSENRTVSNATINREVIEPVKAIFRRARTLWHCYLPLEPHWKDHWLKEAGERVRELQEHERIALDAAIRPDYMPWYLFAHLSARRLSETIIRWEDVHWDSNEIVTRGKRDLIVRTPLTPSIRAILEPLKGDDPVWVFTFVAQRNLRKKGIVKGRRYPITTYNATSEWCKCRKKAGVRDFRFHDLRHDRATKLLRQTKNLKLVQLALNHANIATTAKYAHVMQDELAAAMEESAKSRN
ncbi:tyrosine-type recombinase/integrase [Rhizobium leguminosarum]|uniref:tyrosine-type recombinase/integrase n=1 Tax=Rhizobium leguminosarum TaxID=384 RepID=UPI001C98E37B|nr:tyrosine-type recombinase/integrase [Rhizobium leguminosarum]MBY5714462.1 tyrosine-type recombinase/integrase [Rhizobium leguminosarum]